MAPSKIKEETEDRIVLVNNVAENVVIGSAVIIFGLYLSWIFFFLMLDDTFIGGLIGVIFGGLLILMGLHMSLKETVIIDRRLQNIVSIKEYPLKNIESIEKIPFSDLKTVEITYNTDCEKCSYDSPSMSFWSDNGSWDVSIIPIDRNSIQIYHGNNKSKAEKISRKICRITGKTATHRTNYTPPISW